MPEAVFLGLGYTVRPLAEKLAQAGWLVTGTTRDRAKAMTMTAGGIRPLVWEAPASLPEKPFETADLVVISTAPKGDACPAIAAMPSHPFMSGTKILYLSSSGVYGDFGGGWVDETAPCNPSTERGRNRLAAEQAWQTLAEETRAALTLCRLAGIYGPGRSAVDSLKGDTPGARAGLSRRLIKPGQVFNRIHRDDIVRGLSALIDTSAAPDVINFTDNLPSPPAEPITFAAEILGIEPPPEVNFEDIKDELSSMARSFYAENKRLKNDRLRALVGELIYPTYKEGLSAIREGKNI